MRIKLKAAQWIEAVKRDTGLLGPGHRAGKIKDVINKFLSNSHFIKHRNQKLRTSIDGVHEKSSHRHLKHSLKHILSKSMYIERTYRRGCSHLMDKITQIFAFRTLTSKMTKLYHQVNALTKMATTLNKMINNSSIGMRVTNKLLFNMLLEHK